MTKLHGKNLTDYAEGAIEKLTGKLERATSEAKIEKLAERRDYWIQQWEKETGERYEDDTIRGVEDLQKAVPGIPIILEEDLPNLAKLLERWRNEKPETD